MTALDSSTMREIQRQHSGLGRRKMRNVNEKPRRQSNRNCSCTWQLSVRSLGQTSSPTKTGRGSLRKQGQAHDEASRRCTYMFTSLRVWECAGKSHLWFHFIRCFLVTTSAWADPFNFLYRSLARARRSNDQLLAINLHKHVSYACFMSSLSPDNKRHSKASEKPSMMFLSWESKFTRPKVLTPVLFCKTTWNTPVLA